MTSPVIPRPASKRGSRANPESMTASTPGTVSADSATEVATMIRRPPACRIRSCSPEEAPPDRPIAGIPAETRRAVSSSTSRRVGTKTSTDPAVFPHIQVARSTR